MPHNLIKKIMNNVFYDIYGTSKIIRNMYFVGFISLFFYSLTKIPFTDVSKIFEVIFVVSGYAVFICSTPLFYKNKYLILLIAALGVQLFPWLSYILEWHSMAMGTPSFDRLTKLFFFVAIAVLLQGKLTNVFGFWLVCVFGFFAVVLTKVDVWGLGFNGERVDFGIRNAQHTAMFFGCTLLASICFASRVWTLTRYKLFSRLLWATILLISIAGVLFTQTRAIFLALFLAFMIVMVVVFFILKPQVKTIFTFVSAIAIVSGCIYYSASSYIESRYQQEESVITSIINGEWDNVPYTSVGIRFNTWKVAVDKIMERPLFGFGHRARSEVIKQSTILPDSVKQEFGHLHNYPLEILLSYGLCGVVFFAIFYFIVLRDVYLSWLNRRLPTDIAVFCFAFFVFFFIINFFESYLSFWTGVFVFNIIVGGVVSLCWRSKNFSFD